jgi:NAD(P)-dependent dehydrogenase (short-subunit alcohol dehydrogenase family)
MLACLQAFHPDFDPDAEAILNEYPGFTQPVIHLTKPCRCDPNRTPTLSPYLLDKYPGTDNSPPSPAIIRKSGIWSVSHLNRSIQRTKDSMQATKRFDLQGAIAAVTGGGGALCGAMASALAELGVKVAIIDKQAEGARQREALIGQAGGTARAWICDVLDPQQLKDCYGVICDLWGPPDYLVNGAGGNHPRGTTDQEFLERAPGSPSVEYTGRQGFFDLDPTAFRSVFDLNFMGTFLTTQVFCRGMVAKKHGAVLNISSMSAITPLTKVGAYSAAKAAVSNFTRWLAVHFARTGVRVNALAPGFIMTEQLRFLHVDPDTGQLLPRAKKVIAHTPMGRYGEPDDLIGAVIWLLSDAAAFVTGVVVPIDGGFSAYSI